MSKKKDSEALFKQAITGSGFTAEDPRVIVSLEAVTETNGPKVEKIEDLENGKFELTKKPDNSTQKDALLPLRPIWLPIRELTRTQRWLEGFI